MPSSGAGLLVQTRSPKECVASSRADDDSSGDECKQSANVSWSAFESFILQPCRSFFRNSRSNGLGMSNPVLETSARGACMLMVPADRAGGCSGNSPAIEIFRSNGCGEKHRQSYSNTNSSIGGKLLGDISVAGAKASSFPTGNRYIDFWKRMPASADNKFVGKCSPTSPSDKSVMMDDLTVPLVVNVRLNSLSDTDNSDDEGYVVFAENATRTTPSASPVRCTMPKPLCEFFNAARQRFSGYGEDDDDDDEEDDDDKSIIFCYDYDSEPDNAGDTDSETDDDDKSSPSSGFAEKKVRFNPIPVVHVIRAWDFAYRQARKGEWEQAARDRERFQNRLQNLETILDPALDVALRERVYRERFAPDAADTGSSKDPLPVTRYQLPNP